MSITLREYHALAMRTSPRDGHDKIDNGMLGLIGETGELVDVYKKWVYQSTPGADLPVDRLADELGDVLWYLVEIADGLETNIADLACVEFDRLTQNADALDNLPQIRRAILDMAEYAMLIEQTILPILFWQRICGMLGCAAILARIIGVPLDVIAERNIEKLRKRYPVQFDPRISEARYE